MQANFQDIVAMLAVLLRVVVRSKRETRIIVGGLLARYEYDLRSQTDPHFINEHGRDLLASEVKTSRTWNTDHMWYHGCRGVQVFSALYAFNCPTLLLSQSHWKLLVENKKRNGILTFPFGTDASAPPLVNASDCLGIGTTFLKAIVICLLSQRPSLLIDSPRLWSRGPQSHCADQHDFKGGLPPQGQFRYSFPVSRKESPSMQPFELCLKTRWPQLKRGSGVKKNERNYS